LLALCSCQRSPNTEGTLPTEGGGRLAAIEVPERVTDENYFEVVRRLHAAPGDARGRGELRDLVIQHLGRRFDEAMSHHDTDGAWTAFTQALGLYPGQELQRGVVSSRLGPMAEAMLGVYEPRGDEGKVLVALVVLTLTAEDPAPYSARYSDVSRWSTEARQAMPSDTERVFGLIRIWEQVTSNVATQEPVETLTDLYLERHLLLQGAFTGPPDLAALLSPSGEADFQNLLSVRGQSVADIVTLYLRAGRASDVRRAVGQLGNLVGPDRELVQATRNLENEHRRAEALVLLASNLGREHPDVALRLCHQGHRELPGDERFCLCLAELYRHFDDVAGAFEYYEAALEAAPTPENYDQALRYLAEQLQVALNTEDTRGARETFTRAERVLAGFIESHPDLEPPIRRDQLMFLIGMGEYNSGNIDASVQRFEASNASRPNRASLLQLGIIAERRGHADQAVRLYRSALDQREDDGENPLDRAVVLGHLADATALAGQRDRAQTLYNEALEMLRVAAAELPPQAEPEVLIERGIVLHRLGRAAEGNVELNRALAVAPQRRATYGRLLSFYVGHGMVEESIDVFRMAFNHSDLERIWKIYFSMWLVGLQQRLGQTPDPIAERFLESVEGEEWIDLLGRYYAGSLPFETLLSRAETQGQRAEAYYYEAVLQLAGGNRERADQLLQQVIDTDMLGYYEYEFALLIRAGLAGSPPPRPTASAPAHR
jgi:tetratricopeptide (TPR) repeat protein